MPRFLDEEEDGTPCPQRLTRSSTQQSEKPITTFPLAAASDDDYDEDDLDYTRALPSGTDYQLTIGQPTRKKGLKEPPRRITYHVPAAKPQQQDQQASKEAQKRIEEPPAAPPAAAPTVVETRPQGLQQLPRRSIMPGRPMRPRVSAMLKARHSNDEPPVLDEAVVQANERARSARVSDENAKRRQALGDKTQPPPNVPPNARETAGKRGSTEEKKQLQAPPKRPLQPAAKPVQQEQLEVLVKGRNSGKENFPPGGQAGRKRSNVPEKGHKSPTRKSARLSGKYSANSQVEAKEPTRKPSVHTQQAPREQYKKRTSDALEGDESFTSTSSTSSTSRSLRLIKRQKRSMDSLPSPPSLTAEEEAELLPPEDFLFSGIASKASKAPARRSAPRALDPVLKENLERCEMYEQSWLEAQESSVTQLLNYLLAQYSPAPVGKPPLALRREFLAIYRAAPFPLIYNRVHASLLYGALSITQSVIDKSSSSRLAKNAANPGAKVGWGTDVGLREKFLHTLMGSYEQSALIIALEVVVGREMFAMVESWESEKKILERFIERYLINSEDLLAATTSEPANARGAPKGGRSGGEDEDKGSPAWLLRRTLLRTFMLILLLDKAKARGVLGRQCLFKKPASNKSSSSVLNAVTKILLPSTGNVSKSLSQLNYSLETTQPALAEYDYTVNNIAVDMRDGVRLARLVEVILHSKRRDSLAAQPMDEEEEEDWALSPHLQYPANSRVQKLHNVNLVLNALKATHGDMFPIDAKDIVDGHRENTVGLLWSLLGQKGLELLVDWDVVKLEIQKLERHTRRESTGRYRGETDHVSLLKNWASGVAAKHGLEVENLTTSFADGRVFSAIVNEYQQYLPSLATQDKDASLEAKLKAIGCNSYFAGLFDTISQTGRVFSQDFVVSGLAYLCSRLLQPSISERAAMVIQRAFQQYKFRMNLHRRIRLLMMAHDCAETVNTRNKVLGAAITIQRAYRAYLHVKIQALVNNMTSIQSLSRGFLARRRFDDAHWAAVVIQRKWRSIREKRFQVRMNFVVQEVSAVQAISRGMLVRRQQEGKKRAVFIIQDWWRNASIAQHTRAEFIDKRNAALVIQKKFRQFNGSKDDRLRFFLAVESVKYLQAAARGLLVRQRCAKEVEAASKIQQWFRSMATLHRERAAYNLTRSAAITIQRHFRSMKLDGTARNEYLRLKLAVLFVENRYIENKRKVHAAIVLQRAWRSKALLLKIRRKIGDIVKIQSLWRGSHVRSNCSPRLRIIRKRISKTLEKGVKKEDTLEHKTLKCMRLVKRSTTFNSAAASLELYTSVSSVCAALLAREPSALAAIVSCVDTVVQNAQSTTSKDKIALPAMNILLNLTAFPESADILAAPPKTTSEPDACKTLILMLKNKHQLAKPDGRDPCSQMVLAAIRALNKLLSQEQGVEKLKRRKKWIDFARPIVTAAHSKLRANGKRGKVWPTLVEAGELVKRFEEITKAD